MTVDKTETVSQAISSESNEPENEENSEKSDSNEEPASPPSEKEAEEPEWTDLLGSGAVLKKVLQKGTSELRPCSRMNCVVNYDLKLADGTFIERKENFKFQVSDNEVVQGLDVGIPLMHVGETARFKIVPRLAYGSIGLPPKIPPNADVVFDVELISADLEVVVDMLPMADRKYQGNKKRETGNFWYGRGDQTLAIYCYRRALDYIDDLESNLGLEAGVTKDDIEDADLQELFEMRMSVVNNMAAAQIKAELYEAALTSLETVLRCQPNNLKALFRKATVLKAKRELPDALKCLKKANDVSPGNADVQKEIAIINKLIQKDKVKERELAKRMFGERSTTPKEEKREPKTSMLIWSATLAASFAVGLVGIAFYRLRFS